ncbi:MAG: metallophosphoesterase family protein [Planctomycetota bacterium]
MIAFLSDLHSNQEAMEAVLRDVDEQGVETVVCLGDIVGYGASPREVVQATRQRARVTLLGNHDAALLDDRDARGFNERALQAIDWTRRALDPEREENWDLWDWLGGLVPAMELTDDEIGESVQIVHASPCDPLSEYLLPSLGNRPEQLQANFEAARHRVTFFGHTHHSGFFPEGGPFVRAAEAGEDPVLDAGRRYLVNVGSVGQPRDGDPRLGYALFDGERVRWRRLPYDVQTASRKILEVEDLPDSLGSRLLMGR